MFYGTLSFVPTLLFYRYQLAHFFFIILGAMIAAKNGADFYAKVYRKKQKPSKNKNANNNNNNDDSVTGTPSSLQRDTLTMRGLKIGDGQDN